MNKETLSSYFNWLSEYFMSLGMGDSWAMFVGTLINCIITAIGFLIVDFITRKVIVQIFRVFSGKTKNTFDDFLVISNFPRYTAHLIPLYALWSISPILLEGYPSILKILLQLIDVYFIILCVLIFRSFLKTTDSYLKTKESYADKPLNSYLQVLMIFAWGIGIFFIINDFFGYSVISLTTLGAFSAAILLIFRDTILGFVASIQVTVNDIVRIGDWITFSKYGADGVVAEINLATVLVRNWDYTFTTIPTYSLTSDSFQNWRGMQESDGRRIKRSVFIAQNSVKFLTEEDISELKKIELISGYLDHRQSDIQKHNERISSNKALLVNGRNQTNLGVFRKYISTILDQNPAVNKDMMLMVRQLEPTDRGIPIQIYCFSKDKVWQNYEYIMGDIFDHVLAAVPYFGLEVFELPSTTNFKSNS